MMNTTPRTPPEADDYSQYPEYTASVWIWKICPPVLIILGTIGNTLSIVVLTRKSMRESTVSVYLTALAFADLSVLYTGLLRHWIRVVFMVDVQRLTPTSCKVHLWMVYFTVSVSAWLQVAVTIERFISVWFPHKVKTYCSHVTAGIAISTIAVFFLLLGSHALFGMGNLVTTSNGVTATSICTSLWEEYDYFKTRVWPLIALVVFSLVPFIILIVANISIVYKVVNSRRHARRIYPVTSHTSESKVKTMSSMTVMLMALNAVYFVCTLPICVFLIWRPSWIANYSPHRYAVMTLFEALANTLMYTNNAVNFLMYCISGSRFRTALKCLFLRRDPERENHSFTLRVNNDTLRTNISEPLERFSSSKD